MEENILEIEIENLVKTVETTHALLLDVRHQSEFVKGYIPNSLFIGIDGPFEKWVQLLVTNTLQPIILVIPKGREKEVVFQFKKLGYTQIIGFLNGGFEAWEKASKKIDVIPTITAQQFKEGLSANPDPTVYDIRKISEHENAHIHQAQLIPLEISDTFVSNFPKNNNKGYVFCGGGYRSVLAISILKKNGIDNLINISGGFKALQNTEIEVCFK